MKYNIRTSIVIGLVVIAMCSFVTGCANKKDSAVANSNDDLSNKYLKSKANYRVRMMKIHRVLLQIFRPRKKVIIVTTMIETP